MKHPWHDLQPGRSVPGEVTCIVEIPAGSRNKYELDKDTGLFALDRVLYSAVHYPGDYGFIPRTLAEDGDPCDVLVLIREPTFPGCQIDVRPIGVMRMEDRGEPDAKILAVPSRDPLQGHVEDMADLPAHLPKEIEHFFNVYKDLEGHLVHVSGWEGRDAALQEISASIVRYLEHFGGKPDPT